MVCNRNTVRESSHILFFCSGDPFCKVGRRPENTHEELTGLLELLAGHSLRLRDQRTSPLLLSDQRISAFSPKITDLILSFQVPRRSMTIFFASRIFLFMAGYRNILPFFSGNLLILSANGNICHSIHRQYISFFIILLYLIFPVTHFVDVIFRPHWIC